MLMLVQVEIMVRMEIFSIFMLYRQKHVCYICGGVEIIKGKKIGLSVDHCHKTLKVRGLLCGNCNRGLGLLQDNPDFLRKAADYIEKNK